MADKFRFTILGSGSSTGTPRITGNWGDADPAEPKNYRRRCSLLVERVSNNGTTCVVVDTGPDFRSQMIDARVTHLDGVLYTHAHADHIHGIDDLRGYALAQCERVNIYADEPTQKRLDEGFSYCFRSPEGSMYPPIVQANAIEVGKSVKIEGKGGLIHALPVIFTHGPITALGFRFSADGDFTNGGLCYSPDVSDVPNESIPHLQNLNMWVVDALQYKPHTSHMSVSESLEWIERIQPSNAILIHMHIMLDYNNLKSELPGHITPAYDGMAFEYNSDKF